MSGTPLNILLIEDDETDYLVTRRMLLGQSGGGPTVWRAETLARGLERLARNGVDVVLLDLNLPDASGWQALQGLLNGFPQLPIVLLTGLSDEAFGVEAVQRGAQDYLVKGRFDAEQLARAMRYAIERKRAELLIRESEQRYRRLLSAVPSYTYTVTLREGSYVSTSHSPGCFALTGYTAEEYAANPFLWIGMVHPDDRAQVLRHITAPAESPHHVPTEHRIYRRDGALRWVRSTIVHHFDPQGRLQSYDGLIEDITARKEAEEALRQARDELEVRVAQRTAELTRANTELRDAIRTLREHDVAKSQFVSNVSHELKTPLASMNFAIHNLLQGIVGPLSDAVRLYAVMLQKDCERLTDTVHDILDLSRLESRSLMLHRVCLPLGWLVRRAVEALRLQAAANGQELTLEIAEGGGFARCDPQKMERVFANVVGNALKFTPERGVIRVQVRRVASPGALVVADVIDDGAGIPPECVSRVTERYFRVGEHVSGSGLGLAIAKEVVALHGGTLTVHSPPEGGSRGTQVRVALPAVDAPQILVAGDSGGLRETLAAGVGAEGYRLHFVAEFEAAFAAVGAARPAAVLVLLPAAGLAGVEFVGRVRAGAEGQAVPMLALADNEVGAARQEILRGFRVGLLVRPFGGAELSARIEELMYARRPSGVG